MFLLYLFVCNCTCECMFCVGDHLVQAVLPFVLPIFGKIDNNNNNNNKLPVILFTSAELFSFFFLHWVPGTCSFLGAPFLQRRFFWGGYHSFLSVIDSTFGLKGNFFGNEQLTLMQNIILESQ